MTEQQKSGTDRREVLRKLGTGTLLLPLATGTTAAQQIDCSLNVSVEAGEGRSSNWVQRNYITDDFRGKVTVSGVRSGAEIAYMMVPTNPEGGFASSSNVRSDVAEVTGSSESIVHSSTWNPGGLGPIGKWPAGRYTLYATVADREQETFGVAVSESFEVDP